MTFSLCSKISLHVCCHYLSFSCLFFFLLFLGFLGWEFGNLFFVYESFSLRISLCIKTICLGFITTVLWSFFLVIVPKGRSTKNSTYNISVSIACRKIYHLFGIVEFPSIDNLPYPVEAYSLLCESTFTNLFCLETNNSDWQKGLCNISQRIIKCPLHGEYESYSQFFSWKISSYVVRFVYELGGKQHITEDRVFTPYLQCPDISAIGQHDKMFRLQDHIHQDEDCKNWGKIIGKCW